MEVTTRPVVITGSSGFIGGALISACRVAGIPVVPFDGDITKPDDVERFFKKYTPDRIIHLAGIHSGTPETLSAVNGTGTENILKAAATYGKPYFLFASSAAVYGNVTKTGGATEEDAVLPNTPYGESKAAAEQHTQRAAEGGKIRAAVLRLGSVYGPGQTKGIIPVLMDSVRGRHVAEYDEAHPVTRQFIHVSDVCRVILALFAQSYEGVVNVASRDVYTISELAGILARKYTFDRRNQPVRTPYTDMRINITKLKKVTGIDPAHSLADYLLQ